MFKQYLIKADTQFWYPYNFIVSVKKVRTDAYQYWCGIYCGTISVNNHNHIGNRYDCIRKPRTHMYIVIGIRLNLAYGQNILKQNKTQSDPW